MVGPEILGGSSQDRAIGMLLERTEAVRELHSAMLNEYREQRKDSAKVQALMAQLSQKFESHEVADKAAFESIKDSHEKLGLKLDTVLVMVNKNNTDDAVQRAQIGTGWKVLAVLGAVCLGVISVGNFIMNLMRGSH